MISLGDKVAYSTKSTDKVSVGTVFEIEDSGTIVVRTAANRLVPRHTGSIVKIGDSK